LSATGGGRDGHGNLIYLRHTVSPTLGTTTQLVVVPRSDVARPAAWTRGDARVVGAMANTATTDVPAEDSRIAIIGMAGRFPGASDVDALWRNLVDGVESLTLLTEEQLREGGELEERIADPRYVRLTPLLDDMEGFDAKFFGYHAREAEIADPQQRIFLEVCATALQHAGYDTARYPGPVGIYCGSAPNRYHYENVYRNKRVRAAVGDMAIEINNNQDYLATRVAYALGLTGPAVSIATACSTAMVAVHLAYRALLTGECTMAVAGGVNIMLPYYEGHLWAENGIYSPDGHIRAFDAGASGTNFGHGAGAVILKRYRDAVADGDYVHAVILGSAVNNDGSRRIGFSAPGADGQAAVISQALASGNIDADSIGYVEAHGTATAVGDPIEINALTAAYRLAGASRIQTCPIGSIKTNIGHLGAAAGIAGLIKAVLCLEHRQIPASLNYYTPNPQINFPETPFYVNSRLSDWPEGNTPRRAGVSSFGIGGTNAHLVIEEAPAEPTPVRDTEASEADSSPVGAWHLLPLSAKTPEALSSMRDALVDHLSTQRAAALADVAFTLQLGRPELEHRCVVVCRDVQEAVTGLGRADVTEVSRRDVRRVAFLFPGQGTQHVDMAAEIYQTHRVFREVLDQCAEMAYPHLDRDLRDLLFSWRSDGQPAEDMEQRLRQTRFAQPTLFAVEYALARQWLSWGVEPVAMVGHSVGEYVAACLADVFTLADALEIVALRGRLTQDMPAGAMLAVPLPEADLVPLLGDRLSLAAVNGPRATVAAGPAQDIQALRDLLATMGVQGQLLRTSHAFHSAMLDPVVEPLRDVVARMAPKPPSREFVSTVTGRWITDAEACDADYWADQLRQTVRFADACRTLAETDAVLLEVGPGQTLTALAKQCLSRTVLSVGSLARPGRGRSDAQALATAFGRLWTAGVHVDWAALHEGARRRRIPLPTYPFQHQSYWVEPDPIVRSQAAATALPPVLPPEDSTFVPVWRRQDLVGSPESGHCSAPWLIFSPGYGPVDAVAEALASRGDSVTRVEIGQRFEELGSGRYRIDPANRTDYDELLRAMDAGAGRPATVVHGWTATRLAPEQTLDRDTVRTLTDQGFYSLLYLSQALLERWPDQPVDLRVLTSASCNITGAEPVDPGKALITGPCRVVPTENPQVSCQLVDVAPVLPESGPIAVGHLLAELTEAPADRFVAYRATRRWVADYEQVRLPARVDLPASLRHGGTYLITGGLGGLGLEVAKELARTAAARLVLVARTALPDRETWDEHLAVHGEDDVVSRRILGVREVEQLGGEVLVAAADVTDEPAMRTVIEAARARYGRIDGVFHAAGVPGGGLAVMRNRAQADAVLAPKVDGTLVLDRLLGTEPDVVVLFSSIVSAAGDYGLVDYCSANAFLDAFAQTRAGGKAHTVAIDWCGWTGSGMLSKAGELAPRGFRQLERAVRYGDKAVHVLLGRRVLDTEDIVFSTVVDAQFHWVVSDHKMAGAAVLPGTACMELIHAAYQEAVGPGPVELRDVIFMRPLAIDGERELQVVGHAMEGGAHDFAVMSRVAHDPDAAWEHHARATVELLRDTASPSLRPLDAILARCDLFEWRPDLTDPALPVSFGPHWQVVELVRLGRDEHVVDLRLPAGLDADLSEFVLHPSLLDGATSLGLFLPEVVRGGQSFLPMAYDRLIVRSALPARCYSHVSHRGQSPGNDQIITFDVTIMDEDGREVLAIEGFRVRAIDTVAVRASLAEPGASSPRAPSRTGASAVDQFVTPRQGLDLLWRMLAEPSESQYVVSREPIAERVRRMSRIAAAVASAGSGQLAGPAARDAGRAGSADPAASSIEEQLLALWQDAFGVSTLGLDEDFFELGGNSLVAVQLAVRVRERFGVNVPGVAVLEYPTVREMAGRVEEALAEAAAN
jgi:acyl transferase domain-containing protein/acyl carrier protein